MRPKRDEGAIQRLCAASKVRRQGEGGSGTYKRAGADRQRLRAQVLEHLHEGHRGHRLRLQLDHSRARHVPNRNLVFALISTATHLASLSLTALFDAAERVRFAGTRRPSDVAFLADLGYGEEAPSEALYQEQVDIVIAPVADPAPKRAKRARSDRKEPAAASVAKPRRRPAPAPASSGARSLTGANPLLGAQPGRRGVRDGAAPGRDRQGVGTPRPG